MLLSLFLNGEESGITRVSRERQGEEGEPHSLHRWTTQEDTDVLRDVQAEEVSVVNLERIIFELNMLARFWLADR